MLVALIAMDYSIYLTAATDLLVLLLPLRHEVALIELTW